MLRCTGDFRLIDNIAVKGRIFIVPARLRDALRKSKRLWRAIREDVGRIRIGLDCGAIGSIAVINRLQIGVKHAAEYPLVAL